jgi:hypothetical protein
MINFELMDFSFVTTLVRCNVCSDPAATGYLGTVAWIIGCDCRRVRVCERHSRDTNLDKLHHEMYHSVGNHPEKVEVND